MSIFSKLFNSEKKDTTYSGPKPYGTLLDAAGGQDYYKTILGRSKGEGVGYGDEYASQYSNPIIKNMRSQFQDYQMPELTSELSATGRRRGSGGFTQIAQAQKEQGLAEGDIYSRLAQQNEAQKRTEQSAAIQDLGAFNKGDYDARTIISNFENANNNRQVQEANQRRANEATGFQNLAYAGTDLLSNFLGGQGGVAQRQPMNYGGVNYQTSQPPIGSNYMQNIFARSGQAAKLGATGGYR